MRNGNPGSLLLLKAIKKRVQWTVRHFGAKNCMNDTIDAVLCLADYNIHFKCGLYSNFSYAFLITTHVRLWAKQALARR